MKFLEFLSEPDGAIDNGPQNEYGNGGADAKADDDVEEFLHEKTGSRYCLKVSVRFWSD